MKTLELKEKSWHYFLAVVMGNYKTGRGDFCSYIRNVFIGLFFTSVCATIVSAILFAIGMEVRAMYTCWFTPVCTFGKDEQAIATGFAIIVLVVASIMLSIWYGNYQDDRRVEIECGIRQPRQPGFVALAYKSIKEKTCFRVEFK